MSDKVKFDVEINKKFSDNIIINYGIVMEIIQLYL